MSARTLFSRVRVRNDAFSDNVIDRFWNVFLARQKSRRFSALERLEGHFLAGLEVGTMHSLTTL